MKNIVWKLFLHCTLGQGRDQYCSYLYQNAIQYPIKLCVAATTHPLTKCTHVESLVSFLMWSWRNQNGTRVFSTEKQHFVRYSTNFALNARCVWYFPPDSRVHVVSFWTPSLLSCSESSGMSTCNQGFLSTVEGSHVRKIPGSLHMHKFNFSFRSRGAWEWG